MVRSRDLEWFVEKDIACYGLGEWDMLRLDAVSGHHHAKNPGLRLDPLHMRRVQYVHPSSLLCC